MNKKLVHIVIDASLALILYIAMLINNETILAPFTTLVILYGINKSFEYFISYINYDYSIKTTLIVRGGLALIIYIFTSLKLFHHLNSTMNTLIIIYIAYYSIGYFSFLINFFFSSVDEVKLSIETMKLNKDEGVRGKSTLSSVNSFRPELVQGQVEFEERNPDFDRDSFFDKVTDTFYGIYRGMEDKNFDIVKYSITNSIKQRYKTQFNMMDELKLSFIFENLKVKELFFKEFEVDYDYDIIHVGIRAEALVDYRSKKYKKLKYNNKETFVEYLSFIRKRGSIGKKESSNKCPQCSVDIDYKLLIDKLNCPSCHSLIDSAEYDFILAEVTQEEDFQINKSIKRDYKVLEKLEKLSINIHDLSIQSIEDKVVSGYMQILDSLAFDRLGKVEALMTSECYNEIKERETSFSYYKFYFNHVTTVNIRTENNMCYMDILIEYSYQKVKVLGDKIVFINDKLERKSEMVGIMRSNDDFIPKGSVYTHTCPNCAGTIDASSPLICMYCGSKLNSPKHEWIIFRIRTLWESEKYDTQRSLHNILDKFYID